MSIWARIKLLFHGAEAEILAALTETEHALLPGFEALAKQVANTIGKQGVLILQQGLADIVTVIESGGNVGAAIAALVPQVIEQIHEDLRQDATNAAHGAASLIIAQLTAPSPTFVPVAPETSSSPH